MLRSSHSSHSGLQGGRAIRLLVMFTLLWWMLTDNAGWGFGILAIAGATVGGLLFRPSHPVRWSPWGAGRFLGYFLVKSLQGGIDVAWRAFHPALPLQPVWLEYPLRLPSGPARILFVNTISLLPGTLSGDLESDKVIVHVLTRDPGIIHELERLEQRVAHLYAMPLATRTTNRCRHV